MGTAWTVVGPMMVWPVQCLLGCTAVSTMVTQASQVQTTSIWETI